MFFSLPNLPLNIRLLVQFILFLSIFHGTFHGILKDQKIQTKWCHESTDLKQVSEKNKINILGSPLAEKSSLRQNPFLSYHILTTFEKYCPPLVIAKANSCFSN